MLSSHEPGVGKGAASLVSMSDWRIMLQTEEEHGYIPVRIHPEGLKSKLARKNNERGTEERERGGERDGEKRVKTPQNILASLIV
jgi:hypothetical protein